MSSFKLQAAFEHTPNYTFIYSLLLHTRKCQEKKKSCKAAFMPSVTNCLAFPTAGVKCWNMSEQTKEH